MTLNSQRQIRVLVVDDSPFIRHTLTKNLDADPEITVVGQAVDGIDALQKIADLRPDVVTLDVQMPRLDGLATLQRIMSEYQTPVVMLSALTQRGARITIQALMLGAVDFVPKPSAAFDIHTVIKELIEKIKVAAGQKINVGGGAPSMTGAPVTRLGPQPFRTGAPVVIIGASTGGPRALRQVLGDLPADFPAAVVIVQHMPVGFTQSLAQRLDQMSPIAVQEAANGDRIACGLALVAPSGYHLKFKGRTQVVLDQGRRRNGVRPAVDVTMESAAMQYGASVIGVVLTGMGADGTVGSHYVKATGGRVIAEHESTCVVYGMPRSVIEAGLADQVVPLDEVAGLLSKLVQA